MSPYSGSRTLIRSPSSRPSSDSAVLGTYAGATTVSFRSSSSRATNAVMSLVVERSARSVQGGALGDLHRPRVDQQPGARRGSGARQRGQCGRRAGRNASVSAAATAASARPHVRRRGSSRPRPALHPSRPQIDARPDLDQLRVEVLVQPHQPLDRDARAVGHDAQVLSHFDHVVAGLDRVLGVGPATAVHLGPPIAAALVLRGVERADDHDHDRRHCGQQCQRREDPRSPARRLAIQGPALALELPSGSRIVGGRDRRHGRKRSPWAPSRIPRIGARRSRFPSQATSRPESAARCRSRPGSALPSAGRPTPHRPSCRTVAARIATAGGEAAGQRATPRARRADSPRPRPGPPAPASEREAATGIEAGWGPSACTSVSGRPPCAPTPSSRKIASGISSRIRGR